ncbi:DUF4332 domain-containing protein [Pleurocapsa sp. CCALA 161]|uniref:DUF4332 domain-containing protein n=1 Tax=Pleurocapsa sp. CCALA 161 TaxID=2107688 RepID=UPI000D06B644|nr:DUF4332 domain-containing protein [Pleurocapsa sp. CCALA 161]PSB09019.1 DUF4332 domain-containing protein [Pleurocapsa sp. CCALA 161]
MQPQYWSIDLLPGLMLSEQKLLKAQEIENTLDLLQQTKTLESKIDLASKLKLHLKHLNKWIALADLARIPSVGNQYCGLILHAGIVSVVQLAQTPFPQLHRQIVRLQVTTIGRKDLTPSVVQVRQWIEEAKILSN